MSPKLRTCLVFGAVAAAVLAALCALAVYAELRSDDGPPFDSNGPQSSWTAMWAGDVDGDGTPDVLLSTPFEHVEHGYGSVRVISGKTRKCLRTIANVYHPNPSWSAMGAVGDVNGDKRDDVFVERDGRKTVISVDDGRELLSLDCQLSQLFTSVGDVDGDGCADLLVGGYPQGTDKTHYVSLVSGKTGTSAWSAPGIAFLGADMASHSFGWCGCAVGDVDRDRTVDVAVNTEHDRVRLLSGRNGTTLRDLDLAVEDLGGVLAPIADLNGDGKPELLVRGGHTQPIRAVDLHSGATLLELTGPSWGFLNAVCSVGDQNGDGTPDIGIGWANWFGIDSGVDGHRLEESNDSWFAGGHADLDGDGHDDLLFTHNVYSDQADVWRAGRIEVLSGRDRSVLFEVGGDDLTPIRR